MPPASTLALFVAACLALAATPGPDMLLLATRSISHGRAAGFASLLGAQVGTYCYALAAAFGLSQLFLAAPFAYDAVRYTGVAYLLYLAWKAIQTEGAVLKALPVSRRFSIGQVFWQGLATNLLNPKMALFMLVLFPQFIQPNVGSIAVQIMLLATLANLIGFVVNGAVILAASRVGKALATRTRFRRAPQVLLGTVFAGLAVRLALDGRR